MKTLCVHTPCVDGAEARKFLIETGALRPALATKDRLTPFHNRAGQTVFRRVPDSTPIVPKGTTP